MLKLLVFAVLAAVSCGQILIIPETKVDEPFKNNPVWEDFKIAQMDRIKVLKTLVDNVWDFLDGLDNDIDVQDAQTTFIDYHVQAFKGFFRDSERRLAEGNPYAVMEPAIHIHSIDTLLKLSEMSPNLELDRMRLSWMEVDAMALRVHETYNETITAVSGKHGFTEALKLEDQKFPTWSTGEDGGKMKQMSLSEIVDSVSDHMESAKSGTHMLRGLVDLLQAMDHAQFSKMSKYSHYCYGNNEFGVFQDMYHVVTDAALYLCMMHMKKLVLDVIALADAQLRNKQGSKGKKEGQAKEMFERMQQGIHKIVGFEYRQGSDYTDLPHAPIFKCDLGPVEGGKTGQWGKTRKTGLSPEAGPTHPFDPQAGPEHENSTMYGYIDERIGQHQFVSFQDAFYGYLESELVLNPASMCKGTCPDYRRLTPTCNVPGKDCDKLRATHCDADDPGCMKQNVCSGLAKHCIRTSHAVQMCHAENENSGFTHYNFPPLKSMGIGANMTGPAPCSGKVSTAMERWEMEFGMIMTTPQYCELCQCTCMAPKTQHFISLEPQMADVKSGFIVTGIRFTQFDNVLSLQIEQGKPRLNGEVDESTVEWVTVSAPSSDTAKVPLGVDIGGFHRMNFDLLVGSVDEVVTGVQFYFNQDDQAISLKIQVAKLSKGETGDKTIQVEQNSLKWINPPERDTIRRPLELVHPADPTKQPGPSMPDVFIHSYVEFTVTDYFADLGKLTVPYFDTQPVHNYQVRRWLQGLGLLHKGKLGFGGFISPMIVPSKGKGCQDSSG